MRAYSNWQRHLDEVFVKINGETHYLWRAVDHEGEVLERFVTKRRDRKAALKFLRKTMKCHGRAHVFVTDNLRSCAFIMLHDEQMAGMATLLRSSDKAGQRLHWAVASTGRRNTLIFSQRWSDEHEVSPPRIFYGLFPSCCGGSQRAIIR
jgi:transposase-like protein